MIYSSCCNALELAHSCRVWCLAHTFFMRQVLTYTCQRELLHKTCPCNQHPKPGSPNDLKGQVPLSARAVSVIQGHHYLKKQWSFMYLSASPQTNLTLKLSETYQRFFFMKPKDQGLMINPLFITKGSHRLLAGHLCHTYCFTQEHLDLSLPLELGKQFRQLPYFLNLTGTARFFGHKGVIRSLSSRLASL